jgi:hypothetical protein
MPLEIRELVIKASVSQGEQGQPSQGAANSPTLNNQPDIVATCVEQVLAILQERSER